MCCPKTANTFVENLFIFNMCHSLTAVVEKILLPLNWLSSLHDCHALSSDVNPVNLWINFVAWIVT